MKVRSEAAETSRKKSWSDWCSANGVDYIWAMVYTSTVNHDLWFDWAGRHFHHPCSILFLITLRLIPQLSTPLMHLLIQLTFLIILLGAMSTDLPQSPFPFAWNCCRIRDGNAGHRITVYLYKNMAMSIHKHLSSDQKAVRYISHQHQLTCNWNGLETCSCATSAIIKWYG